MGCSQPMYNVTWYLYPYYDIEVLDYTTERTQWTIQLNEIRQETITASNDPMHQHGHINVCWFNFDALAQGNAYEPTKEPINYRTHDLQTEATPPAANCLARSLHTTEIVSKNTIPMTCPRLHWTTESPSGMHRCQFQHQCVLILKCAQYQIIQYTSMATPMFGMYVS